MGGATVVWDDRFRAYDFGPGHPFTEASRWLAVRLLEEWDADPKEPLGLDWLREVEPAPAELLARFHSLEYLDTVRAADAEGRTRLLDRGDTPSFPGCYEASARLVAGTVAASRAARASSARRAFQPGGGLHHAHSEQASGFCIFNDVGVAISEALDTGLRRIAYVDIDVHHGDGVMYGFYPDGRLLDIDFHESGRSLFPGTGEPYESGAGDGAGLKVNVPLPAGSGDASFLRLYERLVPALLRSYRPDMIILQSGVDGHVGDALGHLTYTTETYRHATGSLRDLASELKAAFLVTGGGGYDPGNVARVLAIVGAMLASDADPSERREPLPDRWRALFRATTGREAPARLGGDSRPARASHPEPWEERLLTALEGALGERFPEPDRA